MRTNPPKTLRSMCRKESLSLRERLLNPTWNTLETSNRPKDDELKDLSGEHSSVSEWTDEDVGKFKNRKAPLVVDLDD